MTGIVIDASVALAWLLHDERNDFADRVFDALASAEAVVPAIWTHEVANGLLSAERRRRIDASDYHRALQLIEAMEIRTSPRAVAETIRLDLPFAGEYALTAYDAAYLAVAVRNRLPLATLDAALARAARAAGALLFE